MKASKPEPAKQLKEHLQHQQEPFSLHDYLSERSYMFKNFSSETTVNFHDHFCSEKNLKRSIKWDLCKMRRRLLQAKEMLRSMLYKFVILTCDDHEELSHWDDAEHKNDRFSYVNEVEDKFLSYENQGPTLMNMFQTFKVPEFRSIEKSVGDPMFSSYLRKLQMTSDTVKMAHLRNDKQQMVKKTFLHQRKKRILQKRKQLLFGCEEKARENGGKSPSVKSVSELEDLENMIHEHFYLMEEQYGAVKKNTHLLHTTESFIASEEWRNCEKAKGEIHTEIGDAIMDDVIRETVDLLLE